MEDLIPPDDLTDGGIEERIKKRIRLPRQTVQSKKLCAKEERNASIKKVSLILQKSENERSFEETRVLLECADAVEEVQLRWKKRDELKRRLEEVEDSPEELNRKCQLLAQAIAQSCHLVIYTGAGISTAAKIPDYRGPNGIWTRLQQGKDIGNHDLSLAEPTYTHMALSELYKRKILKYVVSQNCDGLHLRSGLPRTALSELHGNMYIEVCKQCKPHREYWRLFDVTENTARYSHRTMRKCYICNGPLVDTIVHFGERGSLQWPLNWSGACKNAGQATTILCLGSSLKVLKKYPWLWQMDKPAKKRPNLYIVNLQWTPKDDVANLKINGKCDEVMKVLMKMLDIEVPSYDKSKDPIYAHASKLCDNELHTTTQPFLKFEEEVDVKVEVVETKVKTEEMNFDNKDCQTSHYDLKIPDKSSICDIGSNSNQNVQNEPDCLPKREKIVGSPSSLFSIDSILSNTKQSSISKNPLPLNSYALNHSYSMTQNYSIMGHSFPTSILHNQVFSTYSDFIYYPYQTSFLYPGIHNIINPVPFIKEEVLVDNSNVDKEEEEKPSCSYCDKYFNSNSCLFYPSIEAKFISPEYRFSKIEQKQKLNICVCCDYTTDEEDGEELDSKEIIMRDQDKEIRNKIQAGWFGKGYKKNGKFKRK